MGLWAQVGFGVPGGSQDVPFGDRGFEWGVRCCSAGFRLFFVWVWFRGRSPTGLWVIRVWCFWGLSLGLFKAFASRCNLVGSLLHFGFRCSGGWDQSDCLLLKKQGSVL